MGKFTHRGPERFMKMTKVLGVPEDMVVGMVVGKFSVWVLLRTLHVSMA